jgi:uncharacterized protein
MLASSTQIEVRRLHLPVPEKLDREVIPGDPAASRLVLGMSLLLPYLEPYLIRSMHAAKQYVHDVTLREEMAAFCAQEGQHHRQHQRFNQLVHPRGAGSLLQALEEELERDYRRFTAQRSLRFNLAYAEGFEAFTTAVALFAFEVGLDQRVTAQIRDLFRWHLVEELEHRTVAFDAYHHVRPGYVYRLGVGLLAQWHLVRFVLRAAKVLEREQAAPSEGPPSAGGSSLAWLSLRRLVPRVLATYLPWYTPHAIELPDEARVFAEHYTQLARQIAT